MKNSILALILILGMMLGCGCSSNATVNENNADTQSAQQVEDNNSKQSVFHIGDIISISTDNGDYKFSVTKVSETAERNEFSDIKAERVVIVSYEYENISQSTDLHISDFNFKAYDKDSNALESYPADVTYSQAVGTGRKSNGEMAFALNNSESYIELEFYDNMFNSSADCKIALKW